MRVDVAEVKKMTGEMSESVVASASLEIVRSWECDFLGLGWVNLRLQDR
jgi:hypothetical protein